MHTHLALDGRILVLKPAGHLLGGTETEELVNVARDFATNENGALVIDLADVDYMNSLALGALTRILITCSKSNARLKVCNLRDRVRRLFDVVKFHHLFVYFDSETAAVDALAKELEKSV